MAVCGEILLIKEALSMDIVMDMELAGGPNIARDVYSDRRRSW